jgi:hypothetical protein
LLEGEERLLELIAAHTPLAQVLNKVCTALDVQLGHVVSLVFSPQDAEHVDQTTAHTASHFGLFVFCRTCIVSRSEELLGIFEVYCCCSRNPTPSERRLIQRAAQLAALAIECQDPEWNSGNVFFHWQGAFRSHSPQGPPFMN